MRPFKNLVPAAAMLTIVVSGWVLADDIGKADVIGKVDVDAVLEALGPEQLDQFLDGADPGSLVLDDGKTLDDLLDRHFAKGAVASGLVYFPVAPCPVADTTSAVAGKLGTWEIRQLVIRGETTNLSVQGGSASGCGVPVAAESIVANFRIFSTDDRGKFKVAAIGQSFGSQPFISYTATPGIEYSNASVVDLCSGG